jgi:spoIIIJ-associated protein
MANDVKTLTDTANKLLKLMGTGATATVKEENEALMVDVGSDAEAGLLIGNRGATMMSLQTVLGLMLRQKTGEWKRVLVNIADWREKETARLQDMANAVAERAIDTGEEQPIYNLTPGQRREIHMQLTNRKDVSTDSRGEGRERYLVVIPQKKSS